MKIMQKTVAALAMALCLFVAFSTASAADEGGVRLIPFKGYDLDGKAIDVEKSIGNRPVMLIFWASWCPSCRTEAPKLNKLVETYAGRGMDFIGVNVGVNDTYERAKAFAAKTGMIYPNLFDATGAIGSQYALQGVPTVVVADKNGVIRYYGYEAPEISEETFQLLMAN